MSLCLGKRGKWCIYAKYPVFTPPKIRYRYPGGNWQEVINGHSYTAQETEIATYAPTAVTTITATNRINPSAPALSVSINVTAVFPGSFRGTYSHFDYPVALPLGQRFNQGHFSVRVWYRGTGGNLLSHSLQTNQQLDYWFAAATGRSAVLNLNPTNVQKSCRFRVFNQAGAVLLDQTTQTPCPEVEVIPESCTFPNPEVFVRDYINSNISSYAIIEIDPNNSKCVFVNVALPTDPLIETPPISNLAYLCGDCAAPQIRIDCECDPCFDKRCPSGTVNRILVNGFIQCVDANHCVTAEIPYDPNCENPNCFC